MKLKANVIVLINEDIPNSYLIHCKIIDKAKRIDGSFVDFELMKRTINENNVEIGVYPGAQTIVTTANKEPISTFESNIMGTWSPLEACRLSKITKRIVVASSDKGYADQEKLPYTERSPLLGLYPYDPSKACTDILARTYYNPYNLPLAVIRCGNIYDPGHVNFRRIIPDTIPALLQNKQQIIRSHASPPRNYIYVKDFCTAYLLIADNLHRKDMLREAFNFRNNNPITVLDLVKKIID